VTAHWGLADPAAADGSEAERMQAFREAFRVLENRIRIFTSLRIEALDRLKLQHRVDEIGRTQPQGEPATLQRRDRRDSTETGSRTWPVAWPPRPWERPYVTR
jgi:hypothetical protein